MTQSIFRQLQERLDMYSMGFPATTSGIEIQILKYLFSDNDAEMFLALSPSLEEYQEIAKRLGKPEDVIFQHLEEMTDKGLIFRLKKNGAHKYGGIPFVHGIFEFQVKNLKPDFSKMVGDYFDEAFDKAMQANADSFLRVIPVNKSIDTTRNIASYDDAVEILKSKKNIVIADCICRKRTDVIDEGCGKHLEACFMFGSMGQYYVDKNMGREITLDEGIEILKKCRDEGLVTQPATSQNPTGMCNCCGDCCGVLNAISKHPNPADIVFSNHIILADRDECIGCEECLDRCQMDALVLNNDGFIDVLENRCIGCGLCVIACPSDVLSLVEKPEKDLRLPPVTMFDQMMQMAKKRGIL